MRGIMLSSGTPKGSTASAPQKSRHNGCRHQTPGLLLAYSAVQAADRGGREIGRRGFGHCTTSMWFGARITHDADQLIERHAACACKCLIYQQMGYVRWPHPEWREGRRPAGLVAPHGLPSRAHQ